MIKSDQKYEKAFDHAFMNHSSLFVPKKSRLLLHLLTIIFFFFFITPVNAQNQRITLRFKNVSLLAAMDTIQRRYGYNFSYDMAMAPLLQSTHVSINSTGDDIDKVLSKLFTGDGISYRVLDNTILLSKKDSIPQVRTEQPILMQTIKGKVLDKESHAPLANATIIVVNGTAQGAVTDSNGLFSLKIPVGRQSLLCSFVGYENYVATDIMVISGKETLLTIEMQESGKKMQEVTVSTSERRNRPLNAMATVSAYRLTQEDASRYAGGYNDPARMASAIAGVTSGGGGRNDMIIRGNPPAGLLWKLEGIEIPNPNHFTQGQGDAGGVFCIVAADMLGDFDFFTGAFPAEYGNATSGILDLNLRKGNADKMEYALQAGMIGTQLSVEGPINKKNKSSFLFNYRYGNFQFLNKAGIIDLDDNQKPPKFQDINFHVNLPTQKAGSFSIFGIGGISTTGNYSVKDSLAWRMRPNLRNDETEYHQMGVLGLKHTLLLPNKKTYLKSILAFTYQADRYTDADLDDSYHLVPNDSNRYSYPAIRFTTSINHKFNAASVIRAGFIYNQLFFTIYGQQLYPRNSGYHTYVDERGNTASMEGFLQWKYRLLRSLDINAGIHVTNFLLNHSYTIEPRFSATWRTGSKSSLNYGFGLHSRIEPISLYFAKIKGPGGTITQPNRNLQLTKAMHHVLGYNISLSKYLRIKAEAYYQYLYDVPVIDNPASTFSLINSLHRVGDSAYVNKGKGYNKGIELTFEKFFSDNYYFLLTGTLFDSKYKPANGVTYNTRFNTKHQYSFLAGKDFKTGRSKQNIFSMNVKAVVHGGFRYSPAQLRTDNNGRKYFYFPIEETYKMQTPTYVRVDAGFKFRKNNPRYSWIVSLDVQNVSNRQNILDYESLLDFNNSILLDPETDMGIIPILNLKIEF
jgi:hypothetical protein